MDTVTLISLAVLGLVLWYASRPSKPGPGSPLGADLGVTLLNTLETAGKAEAAKLLMQRLGAHHAEQTIDRLAGAFRTGAAGSPGAAPATAPAEAK